MNILDTPLPTLPEGFEWHGTAIVYRGETSEGVPILKIVAIMTPDNAEVFLAFLDAMRSFSTKP